MELMVVLVILSLLALIALPRFFNRIDDAKVTTARVQIQNLETALRLFYLDNGLYPNTDQGLKALVGMGAAPRETAVTVIAVDLVALAADNIPKAVSLIC